MANDLTYYPKVSVFVELGLRLKNQLSYKVNLKENLF